jgi:hypothetical protein
MAVVRLICWKPEPAEARTEELRALGHEVDASPFRPDSVREMTAELPDAVVIDLSRTPSAGRDVGVALRVRKGTRGIPIVFAGGPREKVAACREVLPDATYTSWDRIGPALADAIASPPPDPVVPASSMAGYAGAPLPKKLGIRPGITVALIDAPDGFGQTLGPLPEGATVRRGGKGPAGVVVWFVRSRAALEEGVLRIGRLARGGRLWIAWPKESSGIASDLTQAVVRTVGLASGLVDYKVCRIDETWAGLCFSHRANRQ